MSFEPSTAPTVAHPAGANRCEAALIDHARVTDQARCDAQYLLQLIHERFRCRDHSRQG